MLAGIGALAVVLVLVYTQLRIFVVQPIGAVPEGRTLVLARQPGSPLHFIDSADAYCEREQGYVNLICRGAVLGAVADSHEVLLRLPYTAWLYSISTGGVRYGQ